MLELKRCVVMHVSGRAQLLLWSIMACMQAMKKQGQALCNRMADTITACSLTTYPMQEASENECDGAIALAGAFRGIRRGVKKPTATGYTRDKWPRCRLGKSRMKDGNGGDVK